MRYYQPIGKLGEAAKPSAIIPICSQRLVLDDDTLLKETAWWLS